MGKQSMWRRIVPVLTAGVLLAGMLAFTGGGAKSSAHGDHRDYNNDYKYFLKIDGVTGESTDSKHAGEIELYSFSWGKDEPGVVQPADSGEQGAAAVEVDSNDLHFWSKTGKASPTLLLKSANGSHMTEATLSVRKSGKDQQDYLKFKMTDVVISSYGVEADDDDAPSDKVSLAFETIEMEVASKTNGAAASIKEGWDFKNKKEL